MSVKSCSETQPLEKPIETKDVHRMRRRASSSLPADPHTIMSSVVEARTSAVLASLQVATEFRPFGALLGTSRSSLKGIKKEVATRSPNRVGRCRHPDR